VEIHQGLDSAARIQPEERDYYLEMRSSDWGRDLIRWTREREPALHFSRAFPVHRDGGVTSVEELILPFPSPPIYGINRKPEYGKTLEHRPNMHSMRLLRRPGGAPIHRLFILHHGLNEVDSLRFYYQLADWIMRQQDTTCDEEGVACLVTPFPGHLTHAPYHGPFAETPLSRYLNDAGDLFRQFLRYMVGMRWLLSIIADSDAEDWMVGGDLLSPSTRVRDLLRESNLLHDMSELRIERAEALAAHASDESEPRSKFDLGARTSRDQVEETEQLLRLGLERDSARTPDSLRVHVVGYSLGGFLAQSVFFAWPQVVSSCTTICSGGAISALAPTAFAQPEEWQSVLHALRPETTNSMLQGRLCDDERFDSSEPKPPQSVAGLPLKRYGYFQRIFEQVFLQEDRSSYKERLSEYSLRMLFVSGGEDPIVPPSNILDASPREGTTMLSVAGMTHFLNQDPKDEGDRRETEQRDFWLPEAGGLIARAAIHAEEIHGEERSEATSLRSRRKRPDKTDQGIETGSGLLSNGYMFEAALDWVLDGVDEDSGWLVICRNALPAAFLPSRDLTNWGTGLHHHDLRIQRYTLGLRHRAGMLREIAPRTTLIVPDQLRRRFINLSAQFEPHSDAPGGRMTTRVERERIWDEFEDRWRGGIRNFKAGNVGEAVASERLNAAGFAERVSEWLEAERRYLEATYLPDIWIGIHPESTLVPANGERNEVFEGLVAGVRGVLGDIVKVREAKRLEKAGKGNARKEKVKAVFGKRLEDELADGRIRIVQISEAEFNPRYRGRIERRHGAAARLLARAVAGLIRSRQIDELGADEAAPAASDARS
jgi:pimeloyl-ACP methyl ester carboxylesterase